MTEVECQWTRCTLPAARFNITLNCVCPRFDAHTHTGSMNIIMWPTGQKHSVSESSRGVKGLSASSMAGLAAQTPFDRSFHLDFWIALTGKPLVKECQRGPDARQTVCINVCGWMRLRLLSRVVWLKKDRQRGDKERARGKSDSLLLYRTIIRWEGVNVSHSGQNPLRIKSTSPCLIRTLITSSVALLSPFVNTSYGVNKGASKPFCFRAD